MATEKERERERERGRDERQRKTVHVVAHNRRTYSQGPGPLEQDPPSAGVAAPCVEVVVLWEGWGHRAKRPCCEGYNSFHKEWGLEEKGRVM